MISSSNGGLHSKLPSLGSKSNAFPSDPNARSVIALALQNSLKCALSGDAKSSQSHVESFFERLEHARRNRRLHVPRLIMRPLQRRVSASSYQHHVSSVVEPERVARAKETKNREEEASDDDDDDDDASSP